MKAGWRKQLYSAQSPSPASVAALLLMLLLVSVLSVSGDDPLSFPCLDLPNPAPRARAVNVFDGFTFDDELDILLVRMKELHTVVSKFVVVEASLTHSGQPKPFVFLQNRAMFAEFEAQVLHVALDSLPQQPDQCAPGNSSCSYSAHWMREGSQRNAIMAVVEGYCAQQIGDSSCTGDDVVLISDVDEIPRAHSVQQLRHCAGFEFPVAFELRMHYYTVDTVWMDDEGNTWPWAHAKAASLSLLRQPQHSPYALRLNSPPPRMVLQNAGWHFSYFGGVTTILKKISHLAHQENNRPEVMQRDHILRCILQHEDLFERKVVVQGVRYTLAPSEAHLLRDLPQVDLPPSWWRSAYVEQGEL
jgi:hypothetical protein